MNVISVQEIERNPADFLCRIDQGEDLLVVRGEQVVAEVKAIARSNGQLRPYGLCAGQFSVPDDFDAPLPESHLSDFEAAEFWLPRRFSMA